MTLHCAAVAAALLAVLAGAAFAQDEPDLSFQEALNDGKYSVSLRYRYEGVSQDDFEDDAAASTLRTILKYQTAPYRGVSFLVEAENVTATNEGFRNAGAGTLSNNVTNRPVVADPELTELNQALMRFDRQGFGFVVGRSELVIGTQRFVGAVGWRQNHQSFDGAGLSYRPGDRLALSYNFIDNVNRIFGDNVGMESHVLTADLELAKEHDLQLYGLDLRYDRVSALATRTLGARFSGAVGGERSLLYAAEYATQSENSKNPGNVDAGFYNLELGGRRGNLTGKVGWEVLEGAPGEGAFTTPLATLHKFNGWADKFLATPASGLEDLYVSLSGSRKNVSWAAVYHDFKSQTGSIDYGTELDLQVSYRSSWGQTFALKTALYSADAFATDTDKWMFFTIYSFGN